MPIRYVLATAKIVLFVKRAESGILRREWVIAALELM